MPKKNTSQRPPVITLDLGDSGFNSRQEILADFQKLDYIHSKKLKEFK